LVSLYSTIKMMHGPIKIRLTYQLYLHLILNTLEIMQTVVLGPELCEIDKK